MGMFAEFISEPEVELIGVKQPGAVSKPVNMPVRWHWEGQVLHGMKSYLLQDEDGNVQIASSISAGLDYPGIQWNMPV